MKSVRVWNRIEQAFYFFYICTLKKKKSLLPVLSASCLSPILGYIAIFLGHIALLTMLQWCERKMPLGLTGTVLQHTEFRIDISYNYYSMWHSTILRQYIEILPHK
jgi:hypothetical protein